MRLRLRSILAPCIFAAFAMTSLSAAAENRVTGSLGYSHFDLDLGVELGAIVGTVGYEFTLGDGISITPEFRLGNGVGDSRLFPGRVELGRLFGAATRLTYTTYPGVYVFGTVSYVDYEIKASGRFSGSSSSTEFGFGAGLGYDFTDRLGLEFQYENVDSTDVFTGAFRFRF
ncbi:MAG: outer membrane beta-barrel protein [Wenzhouxiangella sp.]